MSSYEFLRDFVTYYKINTTLIQVTTTLIQDYYNINTRLLQDYYKLTQDYYNIITS